MDKNMINIDDLFRQRFSGGEEKERPGAWMQMRDLLDKEMPNNLRAGGFNWRRMFGIMAAMLAVTTAGIGGYQAVNSYRQDDKLLASASTISYSGAAKGVYASAVTPNTDRIDAATTATDNEQVEPGSETPVVASNPGNTPSNSQKATTNDNKTADVVNSKAVKTAIPHVREQQSQSSTNNIASNSTTDVVSSKAVKTTTNDNNITSDNKLQSSTNSIASTSSKELNVNNKKDDSKTVALDRMYAKGNTINSKGSEKAKASPVTAIEPILTAQNEGNDGDKSDKTALVNKIETKETYNPKTGWKKDTVYQGKVEWPVDGDELIAMNTKQVSQVSAKAEPAAASNISLAANVEKKEDEKLLPLSTFSVEKRKQNYETSNLFEEMVKNARIQLGHATFHPGIIGGINTALGGKNTMYGFQLGVTGTLSLNEKWGIVAELKYMTRFNVKYHNSYNTNIIEDPTSGTSSWDSVDRHFVGATMSSAELPLMVRYSVKRFNFHAGGSLMYNFGFKPEERSHTYQMANKPAGVVPSNGAIVKSSDFSSRFAAGYVLGIGYQLSPAFQVDGRLFQSVWDNAGTPGKERISKDLYMRPSLQLNLSYRFKSNKYQPYREQ